MKTLKVFAVLIVIIGFASGKVQAQADIYKGETWIMLPYYAPDGTKYGPYYSTETLRVSAASGNIIITVVFQLDLTDPRVPDNGVNKMPSIAYYYNNGDYYETLDGERIITADGRSKSVYHVNGQYQPVVFKDDGWMFFPCTGELLYGTAIKEIKYWNNNIHLNFYGAYIGASTGFHYSISGIYNGRIQPPGEIISVPLQVKMEDHIVALININWNVIIDSNGQVELDDTGGTTGECR